MTSTDCGRRIFANVFRHVTGGRRSGCFCDTGKARPPQVSCRAAVNVDIVGISRHVA